MVLGSIPFHGNETGVNIASHLIKVLTDTVHVEVCSGWYPVMTTDCGSNVILGTNTADIFDWNKCTLHVLHTAVKKGMGKFSKGCPL